MKKQLLAIAVSAATAAPMAAMAQENADGPNVYGRFDVTLQNSESITNNGNTTADGSGSDIDDFNGEIGNRFDSQNIGQQWETRNNKSRLGVRGSSDLDAGGLGAIYQLEMQFDPAGDTQDTTSNGLGTIPGLSLRNTYVGLEGDSWGKFYVGRYDSIIKQAEFSVDQFNHTDADIENTSALQNRYNDTLNYESPKIGPGIQVKAQVQPGESRNSLDSTASGSDTNDRETAIADSYGLSVGMEEGNMYGAIAYETGFMRVNNAPPTPATHTSKLDMLRVSGGLDDEQFGVGFIYEQVDGDDLDIIYNQNSDDSRSGWILSGRFNPTDQLAVKAQHEVSGTHYLGTPNDADAETTQSTIGADYMLGKQTKAYTYYSMQDVDVSQGSTDAEFNVLALGMQHKF